VTIDVARASAFAALSILLAGYVLLFRPLETTVRDRYTELDAARATLEARLARTARIPVLERDRVRLAADLRRFHTGDRRAATVDRFLRAVASVSFRRGVAVENIAAALAQPFAPAAARAVQAPLVDEVPLELTLRGAYADVIRAVRDLNDGGVATRVNLASLGIAARRPGEPSQLNAAFHVLLLREADEPTTHDLRGG
jgi:Tfp pilus assembly protein PilO